MTKENVYDRPDWHALVRTIRDRPDDDLPRLVAADWLDEHGEEDRARLLRFGVENRGYSCTVRCGNTPCLTLGLGREAYDLISNCYAVELGPPGVDYTVEIGSMSAVRCPWAWWAEHGDDVCLREPILSVELTTWPRVSSFHRDILNTVEFWIDEYVPRRVRLELTELDLSAVADFAMGGYLGAALAKLLAAPWPDIPVDNWTLPARHIFLSQLLNGHFGPYRFGRYGPELVTANPTTSDAG